VEHNGNWVQTTYQRGRDLVHILKIIGGLDVSLTRERWILHWSVGHRLGGQAMDGLVGEGVVGLVSFTIGKLHTLCRNRGCTRAIGITFFFHF